MKIYDFKKINILPMILIFIVILSFYVFPQEFDKEKVLKSHGLKEFSIKRKDGSDIIFYLSALDLDSNKKKSLWINLQGSGCHSLFSIKREDREISIVTLFRSKFPRIIEKDYYFVLIEKRGVNFLQDFDKETFEYHLYATKEDRADDTIYVINYLLQKPWIDSKKLVVAGYSEGADVAARVALLNKDVSHLGFFYGGGASQMYDSIVVERRKGAKDGSDHIEIQAKIEYLHEKFIDIYNDPYSVEKKWHGHAYRRWSSFFHPPVADMLELNIPIFAAMGTKDKSGAIESFDFVPLAFIRNGKKNLTWMAYPNFTHGFGEEIIENGIEIKKDRSIDVLKEFIEWINRN